MERGILAVVRKWSRLAGSVLAFGKRWEVGNGYTRLPDIHQGCGKVDGRVLPSINPARDFAGAAEARRSLG